MASQTYDHSEFVSLRYYLGSYGCPESSARYSYYSMSGTPNLMFNGTHRIVGASVEDAQGGQYMDVIQSRYFDPAPIRIEVDSFDPATGGVSATVTMYSADDVLEEDHFHLILIEEAITSRETHVTRAMITTEISLTGEGHEVVINESFAIDPGWKEDNLRVVAVVQRQDKEIVQTGSSYEQPNSSVRAMVPFSRTTIGPSTAVYHSPELTVINVGLADSFTIRVVVDVAPAGWTVDFSDSSGITHDAPLTFGLAEQASTIFKVRVIPASAGYIRYHLEVTSPALAKTLKIPFVFITDDVEALLVDDDGGNDYAGFFTAALDAAGMSYGVWDRSSAKLSDDVASAIDLLVWNVGLGYPSLDADDRVFLTQHLDAGKSLFITGQDIGWDLCSGQSGNTDCAFYRNYLHAEFLSDDVNRYDVEGLPGDPVAGGLSLHIQGGDGANNQDYPSWIAARGNDAVEIFSYTGEDWGAGVRSVDSESGARVVYLAFGFEAIDNATDRSELLGAAMKWLGPQEPAPGYHQTHAVD